MRDKRFTPEHKVLRYIGDKDCRRKLCKLMHDYVNKNSKVRIKVFVFLKNLGLSEVISCV